MRLAIVIAATVPLLWGCGDEPTQPARVEIQVTREGTVTAALVDAAGRRDVAKVVLDSGHERREIQTALGALRSGLIAATRDPSRRARDGISLMRAYITTEPHTPWIAVQLISLVCVTRDVRIRHISIRAGADDNYVNIDVPYADASSDHEHERQEDTHLVVFPDDWIGDLWPPESEVTQLRVWLAARSPPGTKETSTHIAIVGDVRATFDLPALASGDTAGRGRALAALRAQLLTHRERRPSARPDATEQAPRVVTIPPGGGQVPTADVLRVVRELRAAGYATIEFTPADPLGIFGG